MLEYNSFISQLNDCPFTSTPANRKRKRDDDDVSPPQEPDIITIGDVGCYSALNPNPKEIPLQNEPFVFYEVREILQFATNGFPQNTRIKTLGKFAFINGEPRLKTKYSSVKLDMSAIKTWPELNRATLEVLGTVASEDNLKTPILVAYKCRELQTNISEYVALEKATQQLFPELKGPPPASNEDTSEIETFNF